jgi:hypothetical protein
MVVGAKGLRFRNAAVISEELPAPNSQTTSITANSSLDSSGRVFLDRWSRFDMTV